MEMVRRVVLSREGLVVVLDLDIRAVRVPLGLADQDTLPGDRIIEKIAGMEHRHLGAMGCKLSAAVLSGACLPSAPLSITGRHRRVNSMRMCTPFTCAFATVLATNQS